jgi:hypothetical protein
MEMFRNPLTTKISDFLNSIGIEVVSVKLNDECFLPGIVVEKGKLLVDEEKLEYPGDLLHEAGHLALAPSDVRPALSGEVIIPGANMDTMEIQVTAWAYAAVVFLGLEPQVLFHQGGYKERSESLIFTFSLGVYPGAYGLENFGMTALSEKAKKLGIKPYPNMLKWVRD